MKIMRVILFSAVIFLFVNVNAQNGYGNQWIFGRFDVPLPSGSILNFSNDTLLVTPVDKSMEIEGSCAIICDSVGKLLFYSNGCYIANAQHQVMENGDSIGQGKLKTSFCKSGGNPLTQGIIALPKPKSNHLYYLFYTDIGDPYFMQPFFPLAPVTLYYALIDMKRNDGLGAVVEKNRVILKDTFSRGMINAVQHFNGRDWWIIQPKSNSNCYWTMLLNEHGIDTIFKKCIGEVWIRDPTGQAVFSPDKTKYARGNYFHGLNIFNFNSHSGELSNHIKIDYGLDTFYYSGVAFSPNSRFIYVPAYNKLWQFDTWASDISANRLLIAELNTPPEIQEQTRFNGALLAPNGRIYISGVGTHSHLHAILNPNCLGQNCNLQQYTIELYARNSYTIPNIPNFLSKNEPCTSSTDQYSNHPTTVFIYPNPSSHSLWVDLPEYEGEVHDFHIHDLMGRTVQQHSISAINTELNVSGLAPGVYYYTLYADGRRLASGRFVRVD